MNIAVDISPINPNSGHKVRGIGTYVSQLKILLPKYDGNHTYTFFSNKQELNGTEDVIHYPYFDLFGHNDFLMNHKTVVTIHDLTPLIFPDNFPVGIKGKLHWSLNKIKLQKTGAIITDSEASKRDIIRLIGISEKKVHVVYLAAGDYFHVQKPSLPKISKFRKKYSLPDQFVLYVGDATWNKNLPNLIDAMKQINLTLVLAGKTIASKDYDRAHPWNQSLAIAQDKMNDDLRFIKLGYIPNEDLVTLYNIADVTVLPSVYEGFGLPILEAMQCGSPVVTTKMGSLPEVAGSAAVYVDPYDVTSIANGIGEVFFTDAIREELIKKGFDQSKKFSWKKAIANTVAVYSKLDHEK